jgi:hypothetical protein
VPLLIVNLTGFSPPFGDLRDIVLSVAVAMDDLAGEFLRITPTHPTTDLPGSIESQIIKLSI